MYRRLVPTSLVAGLALVAGGAHAQTRPDAGTTARTGGTGASSTRSDAGAAARAGGTARGADAGATARAGATTRGADAGAAMQVTNSGGLMPAASAAGQGPALLDPNTAPATLRVTLPALTGGAIPQAHAYGGMGCTGENRSPQITWSGAPRGTRSFAVIAHDPDAPTGVGFFHWSVYNLPGTTTSLAAGAAPPAGAVQGPTDFGAPGYGGPCPPPGETHRYIFTVYALDVPRLEVPATASGAMLRFALRGHTLALGRAVGTYRRP